ncbi:TetR/AcrR family transcriptional regulator [Staphylococcus argenteus]|uniref:TetR/AcrR family transcriptional regulator n=1 Tax=Staphylococcus argenteus TaxID=985002 RepID=UPI000975F59B|nr:TetR/AcrR family transcriptional regulator [Staphylococcus argenteus]ATY58239.1 TetR/AcrR family transcriptional regulator [Staphylococcus argenteus]ATZ88468.1 TetR/AcrR family transcriptional regulator [Staphylococcus argenteus]MDR7620297.1 TetR/AcrR family transcriptional regulator [Staphylococcus argenteus]OMH90802.1 TetR family transcriptional regulator [Staphylococcus argenteus]OMH99429.1 TetR family transcriptional regulator [Staphylococcus argenteus]
MRKDAQENRQRIEELAHKLFSEEGVENISMNRIAKELGIGMGTLYRHFKDKSDLCFYVIQRDLDVFMKQFKQLKNTYHSKYEVMKASLDMLLQFKMDNKALLHCIEAGNNKLRFYQSAFYQQLFNFYHELLKSDDAKFSRFKTDMLLQSLSTREFEFQIEYRHISIEMYRNYLLNIYLDEVERND